MAKKTKIYFWLKLDNNFFKNLAVRALRLTNLMVGLDINDVIERLKSKGYIFESQVLTRRVVALNWEYFNGE